MWSHLVFFGCYFPTTCEIPTPCFPHPVGGVTAFSGPLVFIRRYHCSFPLVLVFVRWNRPLGPALRRRQRARGVLHRPGGQPPRQLADRRLSQLRQPDNQPKSHTVPQILSALISRAHSNLTADLRNKVRNHALEKIGQFPPLFPRMYILSPIPSYRVFLPFYLSSEGP